MLKKILKNLKIFFQILRVDFCLPEIRIFKHFKVERLLASIPISG